jgi:hypothetical protein
VARVATKACETSCPDAASQELAELALDERRHATRGFGRLEERREMRAHDAVEDGVLGRAGAIRLDTRACRTPRVVRRRRRQLRHRFRIVDRVFSRDRYE